MRALLLIVFMFLGCSLAAGRTRNLDNSRSPDGRLCVRVSENAAHHITYDLVATRTGAVLHRLPGSFQPEEGERPNWAWNQTDAQVDWSSDSRYVAIAEEVYRYIGTVLLAEVRPGGVRSIQVPADLIMAGTHLRWDKLHLSVERGWLADHDLSL